MTEKQKTNLLNDEDIGKLILCERGQLVMLDSDVAKLFGVSTAALNETMKTNSERFSTDYCFQLNSLEFRNLISQGIISKEHQDEIIDLPYVYMEPGIATLAGIFKSDATIKMAIKILRTFAQIRSFISENTSARLFIEQLLTRQLNFELEMKKKYAEIEKILIETGLKI